jgi:ferredoxin-thioredoxin reductase catalytic chain
MHYRFSGGKDKEGVRIMADKNLYLELKTDAENAGYNFNPDTGFAADLVEGLEINEKRYGYRSCPCRLATGDIEHDRDIICPCDYRDADIAEYGTCYCALYVNRDVVSGKIKTGSIPERRNTAEKTDTSINAEKFEGTPLPVWRCRVCGYLCAREAPPDACPICKADKARFERFI